MPSPNPYSARMVFQWNYVDAAPHTTPPCILNVGSANDPLQFGELAHHFDLDDWSKTHAYFTQGNAECLPFDRRSFHTVICGDVLEHTVHPLDLIRECCRVADVCLCFTVFEEWKLPGPGQWIAEGQAGADEESRRLGYADREDYQIQVYPERVGIADKTVPHLIHINQFTDADIGNFAATIQAEGFRLLQCYKAQEVEHDGHQIWNWLIGAER